MIRILTGPEGSGKTLIMTWLCDQHYKMGGEVWAFPGFQLFDKAHNVISKEINIEDWASLDTAKLKNSFIVIDEMQNYFDSYRYNSVLANLFTALETERRKLGLTIVGTIQIFDWLPPRLRVLAHERGECFDLFWRFHELGRGNKISVRWCDLKGFRYGKPGMWSRPKVFNAKPMWDRFDTYSTVPLWEKFAHVKVKGREVLIDPFGNPIQEQNFEPNMAALDDLRKGKVSDPVQKAVDLLVARLKKQKIEKIEPRKVRETLAKMGIKEAPNKIGIYMRARGWANKLSRENGILTPYYVPIT